MTVNGATDIPTALDELIPHSRQLIARLRRQYGNPADFDFRIRQALESFLIETGQGDPRTVRFVMRCMFDDR
jgi:hypothetical protein